MASGMPSRRWQIPATAGRVASVTWKSGLAPRARRAKLDGVPQRQRVNGERVLARYIERLPRRGQQRDLRGLPQDGLDETRAGVDQVLAGIEDEKQVPVAQVVQDRVDLLPGVLLGQAEAAGDGVGQQFRVAEAAQLHDPHAVGVVPHRLAAARSDTLVLTDAPRPNDGHEPGVAEELGQVQQLCLPADEIGNRGAHLGTGLS